MFSRLNNSVLFAIRLVLSRDLEFELGGPTSFTSSYEFFPNLGDDGHGCVSILFYTGGFALLTLFELGESTEGVCPPWSDSWRL